MSFFVMCSSEFVSGMVCAMNGSYKFISKMDKIFKKKDLY